MYRDYKIKLGLIKDIKSCPKTHYIQVVLNKNSREIWGMAQEREYSDITYFEDNPDIVTVCLIGAMPFFNITRDYFMELAEKAQTTKKFIWLQRMDLLMK